jgi:threonine dehydratase
LKSFLQEHDAMVVKIGHHDGFIRSKTNASRKFKWEVTVALFVAELADELSGSGEDLHAIVATVGDHDLASGAAGHVPGVEKFPVVRSFAAKSAEEISFHRKNLYAMVVLVAHDDLVVDVDGDSCWTLELAVVLSCAAKFVQESTIGVENLDAIVATIGNYEMS